MEATIVCVDNSEWTRNGDFSPNRFQAQTDAVNLLAGAKVQENPENGVGILTMAGKAPQVWVTPTTDLSKVLNCTASLEIKGEAANICSSVQVAQLALKHRPNKNQRKRIVLFNGSPVTEDKAALLEIAQKLKKNNVSVDVVCFGSGEESVEKLQSFVNTVQNSDNCHFIEVKQGIVLSDALIGTPIFSSANGGNFGAGPSMGGDGEFNVDPNFDPELALALRVSMEEERERQSRAATAAAAANSGEGSSMQVDAPAADQTADTTEVDEDLLQAIAMSMQSTEMDTGEEKKKGDQLEDAELQKALQMSLESHHGSSDSIVNPEFLTSVLESLPGVDPTNPQIQNLVQNFGKSGESSGGDKKEEKKEEDQGDKKKDGESSGGA